MKLLKRIVSIFFVISLIVFGVSFFLRDSLSGDTQIVNAVLVEPVQTETSAEKIVYEKDGYRAEITPLFDYELAGLIVTQHNADEWLDYFHKNDPFNTKDLCVVWGDNAASGVYQEGKYKSGDFTCFWKFDSQADWKQFNQTKISNNHLIPANDHIADLIKQTNIGDQISFKGYLSSYSITTDDGATIGERGTSTTREDTGNNSCEVVYVTDFTVLHPTDNIFRTLFDYSLYVLAGLALIGVILFFSK